MKRTKLNEHGKEVTVIVLWGDHWPGCAKCREVSFEKTASFVNACAEGSALLSEELVKRQAPVEAKKKAEVLDWAKRAGVFKIK